MYQDSCRQLDDEDMNNIVDNLDVEDRSHYQESEQGYTNPITTTPELAVDLEDFNVFSNKKSNVYFWQEYMCLKKNEIHGGLRGIVWRSMFTKKLYDHTKLTSVADARLIFNMSKHVMTNSKESNESFFCILDELHERYGVSKSAVTVPLDTQTADEILKEQKFGIFANLPYEKVEIINNHACISLIGVIQHMMAHKIPIGFTEETDVHDSERKYGNTHGCIAMSELLDMMKAIHVSNKPTALLAALLNRRTTIYCYSQLQFQIQMDVQRQSITPIVWQWGSQAMIISL